MHSFLTRTCAATFAALALTVAATAIAQPAAQVTHAWDDKSLSADRRAELVLEQLTLDEKLAFVHGAGMTAFGPAPDASIVRSRGGAGFVSGVACLGIPDLNLADSAVGIARGAQSSRYSTALPSALSLASTWDAKIGHEYGALIGRELRDQGFNVFLGGGVNITREPRNGRNFEYVGEDPVLAGKMVSQVIQGVQEQNVIGDIKHFVLNDQETGRNYGSANIDKRSMRETDLLPFEIAIKEADPGMVMCSYNRINGDFACENDYTLNHVLKNAWGFKGWVISDWFGTHTTVQELAIEFTSRFLVENYARFWNVAAGDAVRIEEVAGQGVVAEAKKVVAVYRIELAETGSRSTIQFARDANIALRRASAAVAQRVRSSGGIFVEKVISGRNLSEAQRLLSHAERQVVDEAVSLGRSKWALFSIASKKIPCISCRPFIRSLSWTRFLIKTCL